ncbi:MAG: hypothetical protein AAB316_13145, partial [Bacteroidota bacterium]
ISSANSPNQPLRSILISGIGMPDSLPWWVEAEDLEVERAPWAGGKGFEWVVGRLLGITDLCQPGSFHS